MSVRDQSGAPGEESVRPSKADSPGRAIRTLIFAPAFPPAYLAGGPVRTLDALVKACPPTHDITVVTSDCDIDGSRLPVPSGDWSVRGGRKLLYAPTHSLKDLTTLYRSVFRTAPEVVYCNSFFNPAFSIIPQLLIRLRRRATLLVAPRGELSSAALAMKKVKKRCFLTAYRMLRMHRNVYWHASSQDEAREIRRQLGRSARILVRENETLLPKVAHIPHQAQTNPGDQAPLRAVYISRLVPKKGLDLALEALQYVENLVKLDVFGPHEDLSYIRRCQYIARDLPPNVSVSFNGPAPHETIRELLAGYDLMIFPTQNENFGHVVAEALSVSCPVMIRDTTPWTDLVDKGTATVLRSTDPRAWGQAIDNIASLDQVQRYKLRVRAAAIYNTWQAEPKGSHILSIVEDARRQGYRQ